MCFMKIKTKQNSVPDYCHDDLSSSGIFWIISASSPLWNPTPPASSSATEQNVPASGWEEPTGCRVIYTAWRGGCGLPGNTGGEQGCAWETGGSFQPGPHWPHWARQTRKSPSRCRNKLKILKAQKPPKRKPAHWTVNRPESSSSISLHHWRGYITLMQTEWPAYHRLLDLVVDGHHTRPWGAARETESKREWCNGGWALREELSLILASRALIGCYF